MMNSPRLGASTVATMLMLSLIWGSNLAVVKYTTSELSPIFMAMVRSTVSGALLAMWMIYKKVPLLSSGRNMAHGVVVGMLFGIEFALVYTAIQFTMASRAVILLYTAPFWVALMAHFFLSGDRLNRAKTLGLLLAFLGVAVLFVNDDTFKFTKLALIGDFLAIMGAVCWALTTVYLKRYLSHRVHPFQSLFYQLAFGIPLLLVLALVFEDAWILHLSWLGWLSMFYQCVIIAFVSFTIWFSLVHKHPVSLLHAFTFFTPIAGVFFSGVLILNEPISINLLIALGMVSLGLVMVNR
jgi:drug/metabolite transporter (DMT)-like permease